MEHKMIKNPSWQEVNQLTISQAWKRTRDYREQIQKAAMVGLELGASGLRVQLSNHSAMLL